MKAPNFSYYEALTIEDAVKFKSTHEDSLFLAGGQSLMPTLNMRLSTPSSLIDINQIADLKKIADVCRDFNIIVIQNQIGVQNLGPRRTQLSPYP